MNGIRNDETEDEGKKKADKRNNSISNGKKLLTIT